MYVSDLAGHRKYLRTTVAGLSGYSPHHVLLVVSAAAGNYNKVVTCDNHDVILNVDTSVLDAVV